MWCNITDLLRHRLVKYLFSVEERHEVFFLEKVYLSYARKVITVIMGMKYPSKHKHVTSSQTNIRTTILERCSIVSLQT